MSKFHLAMKLHSAKSRHLTPNEIALFPQDFIRAINIQSVQLINRAHNIFAASKILVRHNNIYWKNYPDSFCDVDVDKQALLMHELCHVWQYHTGQLNAGRYLLNPANWVYKYQCVAGKTLADYPIEKQADIMQDWYRMNMGALPIRYKDGTDAPTLKTLNHMMPFTWQDLGKAEDHPALV